MSEALARWRIDHTDPLRPQVVVNDEPVQNVTRVTVDSHVGDVPHLYLELDGSGEMEGTGIVVQRMPVPADATVVLGEFFDALDPAELEREMLEQFGSFGDLTTGEACLAVLKGWITRGQ